MSKEKIQVTFEKKLEEIFADHGKNNLYQTIRNEGILDAINDLVEEIQKENHIVEANEKVIQEELIKSILEDMEGVHPEYHYDIVENFLDSGC